MSEDDSMNGNNVEKPKEFEKVTPESALKEVLENVDNIEAIIIVGIDKKGRNIYTNSFMPIATFSYLARFINAVADKMILGG